ncbi:MAG: homoserine dehydrogenase [Verrucomicrobiales bacterium]|nr:homoserine dehydrogenase [Verrucomicrobiales bacterium]
MKTVGIGLIGCGVVGGGFARHLLRNHDLIAERTGVDLQLRRIAEPRADRVPEPLRGALTDDWRKLVADGEVQIVVELMGGTTLAKEVARAALSAGKPLVTANKALLAHAGEELFGLADRHHTGIYFEASVGGGIPIIKALREGLLANHIAGIHGIINGTCNYILTRMADEGKSYGEILAEAKSLGYAEADESLDVDGIDTAHKAAILASLAYGCWIKMADIHTEGIRTISALDISYARRLGYVIKLLAIIKPDEHNAVQTRVHPTLIPADSVLASVSGVYNAIAVEGDVVGRTLYYGRGAGADATASAVLSDVAEAAANLGSNRGSRFTRHDLYGKVAKIDQVKTRYYIRLSALDQPGVLAQVAAVFGQYNIGISSVYQPEEHSGETVPLLMVLDQASEANFQRAYRDIKQLAVIKEPCQAIRVEDLK